MRKGPVAARRHLAAVLYLAAALATVSAQSAGIDLPSFFYQHFGGAAAGRYSVSVGAPIAFTGRFAGDTEVSGTWTSGDGRTTMPLQSSERCGSGSARRAMQRQLRELVSWWNDAYGSRVRFIYAGIPARDDIFFTPSGGVKFQFSAGAIAPHALVAPAIFLPSARIRALIKPGSAVARLLR